MTRIGTSLVVLTFLALGCGGGPSTGPNADPAAAEGDDAPAKERGPRLTISKETTYVTGPRDKDGYIDYAAALNKRLSRGVTPDNNANVLLWQAMGPHPEGVTMPPEFFRWLGIPQPPERGEYFIDEYRYLKDHLKIDSREKAVELSELLDRCAERPWTAKEYPTLAGYLKANEKPLARVLAATRRSRYFNPLVLNRSKGPSELSDAPMPGVQLCRTFAHVLTVRAMLRIGQRDSNGAWQDLLACHRLGRLIGQGGTVLEGLVAMALDQITSGADLVFLDRVRPDAKRIENCLRDLRNRPPLTGLAGMVDLSDRFMVLDRVQMHDRRGVQYFKRIVPDKVLKDLEPLAERLLEGVDWDPALRNINRWFDRMVAALRVEDWVARDKELWQIEVELKALRKKVADKAFFIRTLRAGKQTGKALGEAMGETLFVSMRLGLRRLQDAADRTRQTQDNLHVAFALAWYRCDHGRYPERLDALAPKYLREVPKDQFSGLPLIYRPSAKGYLLYSVGVNGKDEGGRGYDDTPQGDDLAVRMPPPEPKGK